MIANNSQDTSFRYVATMLRRRWRLIVSLVVAVVAAGTLVAILAPERYTAKAQIVMDAQVTAANVIDDQAVDTRVEVLLSADHLRRVLDSLHENPTIGAAGAAPLPSPAARPGPVRRWLADNIPFMSDEAEPTVKEPVDKAKADAEQPIPELVDLTFEVLQRRINVYKERRSRVIAVTYTSTSPEVAAIVANRAVEVYIDDQREQKMAWRADTLHNLETRIPELKASMEKAESALRDFSIENGFFKKDAEESDDDQFEQINRQLVVARSELAARRRLLSEAGGMEREAAATSPDGPVFASQSPEDPPVVGAGKPRTDPDASEANTAKDAADPDPIEVQATANNTQARQRQLSREAEVAAARVAYLERWKSTFQTALTQSSQAELQYRDLMREAAAAGKQYDGAVSRQTDLLGQEGVQADVRVVSRASIPEEPSSPSAVLFLMPAAVFAFLGGGFLALALERTDRRIWSERTLSEDLAIPCVSLVPTVPEEYEERPHILLAQEPFSAFTNALRSIAATSFQPRKSGMGSGLTLVTSSGPGEGKTRLAVSLAAYAGMLKRRVLLIDMDFSKPGLATGFEPAEGRGILDVLDGVPISARLRTSYELGIDYLPLPAVDLDPLVVLVHREMPNILRRLKESYDCIVISGGQSADTTEAALLAGRVDRVIFVAKWGATTLSAATEALSRLYEYTPASELKGAVYSVLTDVDLGSYRRYRYGENT